MFERADVVARGRVSAQGPTLVYGHGRTGRFPRDARLTTLRISETFKGLPVPELKIVENVCPGLNAGADDEWIVFAAAADARYGPDAPGLHFFTIGGPQGQLRLTNGRVAGPYFAFQTVARGEADTRVGDLATRLRAMTGADAEARSIFERHGWTVVQTTSVSEMVLPAATDLGAPFQYVCGEAPVAHCADLSGQIGLDLRGGAGQDARVLSFVLEFPRPIGGGASPPTGVAVAVGHRVIGAWVVSAVTRDVYAVSDRANVPVDR